MIRAIVAVFAVFGILWALAGRVNLRRAAVPLAVALSLSPAIAGIAHNSWTAGGSDSYA